MGQEQKRKNNNQKYIVFVEKRMILSKSKGRNFGNESVYTCRKRKNMVKTV